MLDAKIPSGPLEEKWNNYKGTVRLVNPANKRKLEVIVIGTGLAGASAAASLGEMGYKVKAFCFQDSPRRAHRDPRENTFPVFHTRSLGNERIGLSLC